MPRLLVMADDLTGANDVGVQFAKIGIQSFVTTDLQADFAKLFERFEVIVVDSESRHVRPETAGSRIFALASRARQMGINHFYKKTDSTLRGNIGSELSALLEASGAPTLFYVPALPQLGRTTREGIQYVSGQPLHQTAFARDPRNPMSESRVAELLAQQSSVPLTVVPLNRLTNFQRRKPPRGLVIFDAETEADLRKIGKAIQGTGQLQVLAGTAGFAECLPEMLEFSRTERPDPKYRLPMLVINGSLNEVSLQQMAHAEKSGWASRQLGPEILVALDAAESLLTQSASREVADILSRGCDVLLQSVRHPDELRRYVEAGSSFHLSPLELHERVARNTGRIIGRLLEQANAKLLVVFGGDTLVGIASALGWPGFLPREELLPGITVSEVANGLVVISKAGGFGAENVLTTIREILPQKR